MVFHRVIRESLLRRSDLDGIDEVRIASSRNPLGEELAVRHRPMPTLDCGQPDPDRQRPTLVVFIDDPDDMEAGARIAAILDLRADGNWY